MVVDEMLASAVDETVWKMRRYVKIAKDRSDLIRPVARLWNVW